MNFKLGSNPSDNIMMELKFEDYGDIHYFVSFHILKAIDLFVSLLFVLSIIFYKLQQKQKLCHPIFLDSNFFYE